MGSFNLITCLFFIIININFIFGLRPIFTSHGHEYEVNYSKEGNHVITNVNGAQEEIRNTDQSFDSHGSEFLTDEINEFPQLLKLLGFNTPPNFGKMSSLADSVLPNQGDKFEFPFDFHDTFYDKENLASNKIVSLIIQRSIIQDNPKFNGFHSEIPLSKQFGKLYPQGLFKLPKGSLNILSQFPSSSKNSIRKSKSRENPRPSLNSGNYNKENNINISKRATYQVNAFPEYIFEEPDYNNYNNYMKPLAIDTQKDKKEISNSVHIEEEKPQKSNSSLIAAPKSDKPIIEKSCDDGITNLEVDWDGSKSDYECKADVEIPTNDRPSIMYCDPSASVVQAKTRCMNETLEYSEFIPVTGDYRPVAPQLGEYKFIPKQRWLNSLDHDAVVLLYHPCADRSAVDKLKSLIMKYYERYIFTAYNLEETAPFAVVTKGCRLVMSKVVLNQVAHFLQDHGPQKVPVGKPNYRKENYNLALIKENRRYFLMGIQH